MTAPVEVKNGRVAARLFNELVFVNGVKGGTYDNREGSVVSADFDGNGSSSKVARSDHYHFGCATLAELAAALVDYWNTNGGLRVKVMIYDRTTLTWHELLAEGPEEAPQTILGPAE